MVGAEGSQVAGGVAGEGVGGEGVGAAGVAWARHAIGGITDIRRLVCRTHRLW